MQRAASVGSDFIKKKKEQQVWKDGILQGRKN